MCETMPSIAQRHGIRASNRMQSAVSNGKLISSRNVIQAVQNYVKWRRDKKNTSKYRLEDLISSRKQTDTCVIHKYIVIICKAKKKIQSRICEHNSFAKSKGYNWNGEPLQRRIEKGGKVQGRIPHSELK